MEKAKQAPAHGAQRRQQNAMRECANEAEKRPLERTLMNGLSCTQCIYVFPAVQRT